MMMKTTDGSAAATPATASHAQQRLPRLLARAYGTADTRLRARLIGCLLRPLSTLGVAAVAAGAFSAFVHRHATAVDIGDFSRQQIQELARFAGEVNPEALMQATDLLAANASAMAAFSAAAIVLYSRTRRRH